MSTQRISDRVAAQLRGLVQEQRLRPGDRLPAERTLAVQLGVSRTALREAIVSSDAPSGMVIEMRSLPLPV